MALAYRAHFVFLSRPVRTSSGLNTSAVFGFTNTLLQLLKKEKPTHLCAAFDTEGPTLRHEQYQAYKATRQEMPEDLSQALPYIFLLLEAFRIPVLRYPGFEADDLMGTLAKRAEREGFYVFLVSPDKDLAQLVSDRIFWYRPARMGDSAEIWGVSEVCKRWGIQRPDQLVDILALVGDSSDNIPGVPGIGEKTASALISRFGSLENLLAHLAAIEGKLGQRLREGQEQARVSKRLVTIHCDVPLAVDWKELEVREPDWERVKEIFTRLEFHSLAKRLFGEESPPARTRPSFPQLEFELPAERPLYLAAQGEERAPECHLLEKEADWSLFFQSLDKPSALALHWEVDSPDPKKARLLALGFSVRRGEAWYVALAQEGSAGAWWEKLAPLLADPTVEKIGHNMKFFLSVLRWQGKDLSGPFFDTLLAHYVLEPEARHDWESLVAATLGVRITGAESPEKQGLQERARQAGEKLQLLWALRQQLEREIRARKQERVFYEIECPLVPVLVAMEITGVTIDVNALEDYGALLQAELARITEEIWELAGIPFNLNSPKQLGEVLFERLGLEGSGKKTPTGQYATGEAELVKLASRYPIVAKILEYRSLVKLKNTYVDTLPTWIFPQTGRIHCTWNQAVTATGRLQCENPNLQNIPVRTEKGKEIRKAFVPRGPGYVLASADYSQIELRIMAALSGDPGLREAFLSGTDIHRATASRIFGVGVEEVTPAMRRTAKMVNFGIMYGISPFGLAQRLGIAKTEAAEIINQYFNQYPGVRTYIERTLEFCREHGYVETVTGRRRYLPDIGSANQTVRHAAERNAINAPIQGTAADLIKLAMIRVHQGLERQGARTRLILQVHDELLLDVWSEERENLLPWVVKEMREALDLGIPIEVHVGVGRNWLEAGESQQSL